MFKKEIQRQTGNKHTEKERKGRLSTERILDNTIKYQLRNIND